ncbi:hypothetical protein BDR04DRAFT_1233628, partial [Suillus decipiens]
INLQRRGAPRKNPAIVTVPLAHGKECKAAAGVPRKNPVIVNVPLAHGKEGAAGAPHKNPAIVDVLLAHGKERKGAAGPPPKKDRCTLDEDYFSPHQYWRAW